MDWASDLDFLGAILNDLMVATRRSVMSLSLGVGEEVDFHKKRSQVSKYSLRMRIPTQKWGEF